ncbi:hypothetical protein, partial [Blastococcus sp. CCUG 61487]|uniref:hypothetical protein n=1 Tax=Blastococcus sp. CCUG 61487 TaxID=1840703 RepID=UPI001BAECADA
MIRTRRLSELLTEAKPGFATGEQSEDGVFQVRMNNVTAGGAWDLTKRRRVPPPVGGGAAFALRPGDVLFNATNSPDLVGKTALVNDLGEPAVYSNHFLRLRTEATQLDPAYLARWLQHQFSRGVFRGLSRQWVNQAAVGRERLLALDVLPRD